MKKSLLVAFVFAMVMFGAKAEYLYWQVGNDTFGTGGSYYVGVYNASTRARVGDAYTGSLAMTGPMVADIGTSGSGSSYYIEVWTYTETATETGSTGTKGDSQGHSATFTYQDLANMNAIATSSEWSQSTLGQSLAVWNATNVVPEPTSGLLTMIGLALLGLKRRRV